MGGAKRNINQALDAFQPGLGSSAAQFEKDINKVLAPLGGGKSIPEEFDKAIIESQREEEDKPEAADPRTRDDSSDDDVSLLGPGGVRLGKGGDEATKRTKSGKRKLSRPGS